MLRELPIDDVMAKMVEQSRADICSVLNHLDDRLVIVVGPCSVHDPAAAVDYASRLRALAQVLEDDLLIVMRVYFEKPRTVTGWKGLINDPDMDETYDVWRGLTVARQLLLSILQLGLPVGCEWLDPVTPQFIADAVAWGAIGARTVESQVHRQMASGLSMPIGFKNGSDGDVQVAVDGWAAAASRHRFFGVTPDGAASVVTTRGNPDCHVVLRGGRAAPNYFPPAVAESLGLITASGLQPRLMIDCSHSNSRKDDRQQPVVAESVAQQVESGERGIVGVMLESFLVEGRQDLVNPAELTYGQSITDACIDLDTTEAVLTRLAAAVRSRRARR
jgi:3-deoxy-7-phosphoheptulonate synthase